jgi:hypothetical protein
MKGNQMDIETLLSNPHGGPASWMIHGDDEPVLYLQIELGNDFAVVLSCSQEDGPRVTLCQGSGDREFADQNLRSFTDWLAHRCGLLV